MEKNSKSLDNVTMALSPGRRRQNPLYDSVENEEKDYNKRRKSRDWCRCMCFMHILVAVVAVMALLLGIINMMENEDDEPRTDRVIQPLPNNSDLERALNRIAELENQYDTLLKKVNSLTSTQSQDVQILRHNLTSLTNSVDNSIQSLQSSVSSDLDSLENRLEDDIEAVSKMEGPQGPPGVGNLTACQKRNKRTGGASSISENETGWIPEEESEATSWIILGMECTVENGQRTYLEMRENSAFPAGSQTQYKCVCTGSVAGENSRYCEIIYWSCPKLS